MKKLLTCVIAIFIAMPVLAGTDGEKAEKKAVKAAIEKAYVNGIQNGGPIEDIENGFHPEFEMFILRDGQVSKMSIGDWVARIKKGREKKRDKPRTKVTHKFSMVNVVGN